MNTGTITQIIGAVVDVVFEQGKVPAIYHAITVPSTFVDSKTLVLEVAAHLGDGKVRAIAMGPTEGLKRGDVVTDTGAPISVPVGKNTLGRIFNVVGEPIDEKPAPKANRAPIHREAPKMVEQDAKTKILETGLKVIDLIAPFVQ